MRYFYFAYETPDTHGSIRVPSIKFPSRVSLYAIIKEQTGSDEAHIVTWQEFKSAKDYNDFNE